ncbi:uncharacterized protein L3040_008120 [Drepanopeziza brunnea f. sp. 'multigermtubi']|uniref:uncharacterized protein n=1 Tax=Drepanopeziza brunnea f. sp. 'multigermtubi' TaxID=698441 RepID=UPI0023A14980|nr:hypothetical protein L3040_008120 [Drepanopeziza brunnea f. sp. 'multigermtubi']
MVPPQGTTIGGKFIPGTTIVSMGVLFPMKHSDAFENPTKCEPERWLENTHTLDNLAWCELYLAFANLFRRFDLSLDGTKSTSGSQSSKEIICGAFVSLWKNRFD